LNNQPAPSKEANHGSAHVTSLKLRIRGSGALSHHSLAKSLRINPGSCHAGSVHLLIEAHEGLAEATNGDMLEWVQELGVVEPATKGEEGRGCSLPLFAAFRGMGERESDGEGEYIVAHGYQG
jgi:hypothetical protein